MFKRRKSRKLNDLTAPALDSDVTTLKADVIAIRRDLAALKGETVALKGQVAAMTGGMAGVRGEMAAHQKDTAVQMSSVHRAISRFESFVDRLRDDAVQSAIETGVVTSEAHYEHSRLSGKYLSLINQELRGLTFALCPAAATLEQLAEQRAMIARELVGLLFSNCRSDDGIVAATIRSRLVMKGLIAGTVGDNVQLTKLTEKAAGLRRRMNSLTPPAELEFDVEISILGPDDYKPWNAEPVPEGRPAFLVAPAYAVGGRRRQQLTSPVIFLKSVSGA